MPGDSSSIKMKTNLRIDRIVMMRMASYNILVEAFGANGKLKAHYISKLFVPEQEEEVNIMIEVIKEIRKELSRKNYDEKEDWDKIVKVITDKFQKELSFEAYKKRHSEE